MPVIFGMLNSIFIGFGKFILCPIRFSVHRIRRKNAIVMIDKQYQIDKTPQKNNFQLFGSKKMGGKWHQSIELPRIERYNVVYSLYYFLSSNFLSSVLFYLSFFG